MWCSFGCFRVRLIVVASGTDEAGSSRSVGCRMALLCIAERAGAVTSRRR
jgi:hypothetical protein